MIFDIGVEIWGKWESELCRYLWEKYFRWSDSDCKGFKKESIWGVWGVLGRLV